MAYVVDQQDNDIQFDHKKQKYKWETKTNKRWVFSPQFKQLFKYINNTTLWHWETEGKYQYLLFFSN